PSSSFPTVAIVVSAVFESIINRSLHPFLLPQPILDFISTVVEFLTWTGASFPLAEA
ncbi:hypothetical protein PIB30_096826, partial [Stylosanthes scabra]|nr:hypothetical protein [Stylosanthes scabra]